MLEHLDAAGELLREGVTAPAALQARAIVEAHAQMLYVSAMREPFSPSPLDRERVDPTPVDASGAPVSGAALEAVQDFRGGAYLVADLRKQLFESEQFLVAGDVVA